MAYNSANRSERLLQGRRFTTDDLVLGQEAFTDVFDLGAGEIFTDDGLIPTGSSQLPYSSSLQNGEIVSGSVVNPNLETDLPILKYYYRHALKGAANSSREVYYFTTSEPSTHDEYVTSDSIIESDQQTNFISPKYVDPGLSPSHAGRTTEDAATGYKVVVSAGANAASATVITDDKYVFDYKTGVLTFVNAAPHGSTDFVYISVYQYIGRTLRSQIDDGSIGGGGGTDITALNNFTGSIQTEVDNLTSITSSLLDFTGSIQTEVNSLTSITSSLLNFTGSIQTEVNNLTSITSSILNFTGSIQTEVNNLTNATSSYIQANQTSSMSVASASLAATSSKVTVVDYIDSGLGSGYYGLVWADNTGSNVTLYNNVNDGDGVGRENGYGLTFNPNLNALRIGEKTSTIKIDADVNEQNYSADTLTHTINFYKLQTGNINIGGAAGTVYFGGSASIAGDLIVKGAVTSINTTELNVEDQFILLNSGSNTLQDGGIIVSSGPNNSGSAFYYDADSNRWALTPKNTTLWNVTSETPRQYIVSVSASAAAPTSTPSDFGSSTNYYGMMYVDTSTEDIYIYS